MAMEQQKQQEQAEKILLQGQAAALKISLSFAESMAVKAVLLLHVPDIIFSSSSSSSAGGCGSSSSAAAAAAAAAAMSVPEIAKHLRPAPPAEGVDVLRRIMRFLAATGFFTVQRSAVDGEARYGLSAVAKCFVQRPGQASRRDLLLMNNDNVVHAAWHRLHECVMGGGRPFVRAHGMDFFKYNAVDAGFSELFNKAMASGSSLDTTALLSGSYGGFNHVSSLVDVGGGTGMISEQIVKRHPNICSAVNFDLPHVIATAPKRPGVEHIAGDMLESVPGAECLLLKFVLHNWNDSDCVKILKACRAALPSANGRVVIVDIVLPAAEEEDGNSNEKLLRGLQLDLQMLAIMQGGHERSAAQWRQLLLSGGFSTINITPLPVPAASLVCIMEAFP